MIIILRGIVILSVLVSLCNADSNSTMKDRSSYIDKTYKNLSETIIKWSDTIDTGISHWLEDNETNTDTAVTTLPEDTLEDRVKSTDAFFQDDKYLDETDNAYIRVRLESYSESKGSSDSGLALRAQIPFKKSKKNLKIFVENITLDNANTILQNKRENDNESPDIGIHYFKEEEWIKSRYSIGLGGIDPFVKARYNIPVKTDKWFIDIVQSFKYSTDNKLEEDTNIYFDRGIGKKSLLRIQLYRKTQEEIDGMDYAFSLRYYQGVKKYTGYSITQSFLGNTKYQYTVNTAIESLQSKQYGGINSYVTSLSWRENIWRKWFYYEIQPSVSFDKQYDYEPNYKIRLFFDFYFGKFN